MGERLIKLTPVQREALAALSRVGEALRYMERLRKKGAVKIETIGLSVFASITKRGRSALPEAKAK